MSSVAPKELEFDTWIYSGQFHEGLRTAPDGTGRHRHLSYWSPVSAVGIRRNGNGRCEWPAVGSWYEGVGVPRFAGTEHMQSDTSSLAVAPDL